MFFNPLVKFKIINLTDYQLKKEIACVKSVLKYGLKYLKVKNKKFNVILVDDKYIRKINQEYRHIDKVTDVISFALLDEDKEFIKHNNILGDIYISIDRAIKQSKMYEHSLYRELSFLTIHGLLHLLGYDHVTNEGEKEMFKKQEEILNGKKRYDLSKW